MQSSEIQQQVFALRAVLPTLFEVGDTNVVNLSPPHLRESLGADIDAARWVLALHLVVNGIINFEDGGGCRESS
jgi:hypothetical protein